MMRNLDVRKSSHRVEWSLAVAAVLTIGVVVLLTVFDRPDPPSVNICDDHIPLQAGAEHYLFDTYDPDTSRYPVWMVWNSALEPVRIESLLDLSGFEYTTIHDGDADSFQEVGLLLVNETCRVSVNLDTQPQFLPTQQGERQWSYKLWIVEVDS
jgi:hypothetical protein